MVVTQEQTHNMLFGAGGGERDTGPIGIHIPVYMNRVLPK